MTRSATRLALLALLCAAAACDDVPTRAPEGGMTAREIEQAVEALGFDGRSVADHGDYVVVEGDIRLSKATLASARPRTADPLRPSFQYHTYALVASPAVHQITVDLSALDAYPEWQQATREAMHAWSHVPGSYVRMGEGSPGTITVVPQCSLGGAYGQAEFPAGGAPGDTVRIGACLSSSWTTWQRRSLMLHELGHALGFRHTDWSQNGESANPSGAVHVPGTPTSGNDGASAMNSGGLVMGLSQYDMHAARQMYPLPVPTVTAVNLNGYPQVSWTVPPGAGPPYTVNLLHDFYEREGRLPPETYSEVTFVGTSPGSTWLLDSRPFTGVSSCSIMTSTFTRKESWKYEVTVTFPTGTTSATGLAPVGSC